MSLRPNILYLHSHDTGRWIQPYGHAVTTPRLQELAEEGIVFRQCFCTAPSCCASRAGLLTGQWSHVSGMLGHMWRGFSLRPPERHIVHTLRAAGYESVLTGIQHVAVDASTVGYDRIPEGSSGGAKHVVPAAIDYLRSSPKRPFFLDAGFFQTHRPFRQPDVDSRWALPCPTVPDTPDTRRDRAEFAAAATEFDCGVGAILDALRETGLEENTLVVCTTDHGPSFPGMKCNLTDHGIAVFLMMRGYGGFSGGRVIDAMVSQVDLFPTLCEIAGIEKPPWLCGRSMMPLVRGEAAEIRDELFAEITHHTTYEPMRAVRTRRWKYIRRFGSSREPVVENCDDSPSKEAWLSAGWRDRRLADEELYDLVFDPGEAHNLAADPTVATPLREMRGRLDYWMRETHDVLLEGPVPDPSAGRTTHSTGQPPPAPA